MDFLNILPFIFGACIAQYGGPNTPDIDICPSSGSGTVTCSNDKACVVRDLCVNGYIDIFGSSVIQKRNSVCNLEHSCCCRIPEELIPDIVDTPKPEQCHIYYDCVPPNLCDEDGKIITNGYGLIDRRMGQPNIKNPCIPDDYPDSPGLCCLKPDYPNHPSEPLHNCFSDDVCTYPENCVADYQTLQSEECFMPGGKEVGICCSNTLPPTTPKPVDPPIELNYTCGFRNVYDAKRITTQLEANDAFFGELPWQAIVFDQNYVFKCGAVLISEWYLVTAAHCVENSPLSELKIRLGEYQVDTFNEPFPYEDYDVSHVETHPDYNTYTNQNGIALIRLSQPTQFAYHINSICLPSTDYTYFKPLSNYKDISQGGECYVSGWGKDNFYGNYQARMKKVAVSPLTANHCQNLLRSTRLSKYFRLDEHSFVCAGGQANEDACKGDGGGPLSCWNQDKGRFELVGIVSWGIGCGEEGHPGVYINVFNFNSWIQSIVYSA